MRFHQSRLLPALAVCLAASTAAVAAPRPKVEKTSVTAPLPPAAPAPSATPIACADPAFHLDAVLPSGWVPSASPGVGSALRCGATSPDGQRDVGVYAIATDGAVDLVKLSENGAKIFQDLGPPLGSETLREWLMPSAVESRYGPNAKGYSTLAHYEASGPMAYIVIAYSKDGDFADSRAVIESFHTHVPLRDRLVATFAAYVWIGLLVLTFPFGFAGYCFREAREHLSALERVRERILGEGHGLAPKWFSMRRRYRGQLWASLAGLGLAYAAAFEFLPVTTALWSLLYLVPVGMGYLGIFLVPDVD